MTWLANMRQHRKNIALFFVPGFGLGCIVGVLFWQLHGSPRDSVVSYDDNKDGRVDFRLWYKNGAISKMSVDRNFDGVFDYTEEFRDGQSIKYTADNNFDRKPDAWGSYQNNRISSERLDMDFNGVVDAERFYSNSLLALINITPNGDTSRNRVERYADGVKYEEVIYTDSSSPPTVVRYDPFGFPLSGSGH